MAKRGAIIDMGRHKPLGSSWRSMDSMAYSRSYEPETRPDFHVYVSGQATAWKADYEARLKRDEDLRRIDEELAALADLDLL